MCLTLECDLYTGEYGTSTVRYVHRARSVVTWCPAPETSRRGTVCSRGSSGRNKPQHRKPSRVSNSRGGHQHPIEAMHAPQKSCRFCSFLNLSLAASNLSVSPQSACVLKPKNCKNKFSRSCISSGKPTKEENIGSSD